MTTIKYLHRPPAGWFPLDVIREHARKRDRIALMIDVDPDDLNRCAKAQKAWVRIPGRYRNKDAAWNALGTCSPRDIAQHHKPAGPTSADCPALTWNVTQNRAAIRWRPAVERKRRRPWSGAGGASAQER